jgi:acetyltransferase
VGDPDGVAWLTLNRPQKRNALSHALLGELSAHLKDIRASKDVRVIVLKGAGPSFCAGMDLVDLRESHRNERRWGADGSLSHEIIHLLRDAPQITIASVHGYCLGNGLAFVNACDLAMAARTAQFGMPEILRGSYGATATPSLFHTGLPMKVAFRMQLTGQNLNGEQAAQVGLISHVVADEDLDLAVRELAGNIAQRRRAALTHAKIVAYAVRDLPFPQALQVDRHCRSTNWSAIDFVTTRTQPTISRGFSNRKRAAAHPRNGTMERAEPGGRSLREVRKQPAWSENERRKLVKAEADSPVHFKVAESLLRPQSVAIVGASDRSKWPIVIFENLRAYGYAGKIFPVNPKVTKIWGVDCYPDLASLPEAPEHALVIVPAPAVQGVLETGVKAGLKSATIYASQIGEGHDPQIIARGEALKSLLERSSLVLSGPNCMGGNSLREKFFGYPHRELCTLEPGSVAFVTQSGGTLYYVARTATQRGIRFNYLLSSGNEISLDLADYVNFLVDDESTRVIALFIEGIRRPQAFMAAAARALKARKPIVVIKTGRSKRSQESARSHTGAISGDYDVFLAMCERYGIVNCPTLEDFIEALLVFQNGRLPKGRRVGWVTTSGGTVDLLFDYLDEQRGIETPPFSDGTKAIMRPLISPELDLKNPLDAGDPANDATAMNMCAAVAADPGIDMVAWAATNFTGKDKRDATVFKEFYAGTEKPVVGFARMAFAIDEKTRDFQNEIGFPFLQGLPGTIRALSALAFYGERAGRDVAAPASAEIGNKKLRGADLEQKLAAAGLPSPRGAFAISPEEAATVANHIGFPVVLKIASAQISHKTEVGGVRLNLRTAEEVTREAQDLIEAVRKIAPDAPIEGFLVQEMVRGTEVILGARTDPLYGPMILVGAGGILVELVEEVSFRLLPVNSDDARAMLEELKLSKLLDGFRGKPAGDVDALVRAICGLSRFYLENRHQFADLEINPLIVLDQGKGVRAVDIRTAPAEYAENDE